MEILPKFTIKIKKILCTFVYFCLHSMLVHYKGQNTLGNKLQQRVVATDHHRQLVTATCWTNVPQRKIFVSATEFCRSKKLHKFCLI